MVSTKLLLTGLIASSLAATSSAFAGYWDSNPEMQFSIINDYEKPAFVGTGLMTDRERTDPYGPALVGNSDIDLRGFVEGPASREKGVGDQYGSILVEIKALP